MAEIKNDYNFKILKAFRHTKTNGGGLLVLYKSNMKAKKILLKDHTKFITFELLMCELTCIKYEKFIIVNIYRLPYSSKHKVTPKMFLEEFEILVESLISTSSKFVLVGDFNLHVNNPADYYVKVNLHSIRFSYVFVRFFTFLLLLFQEKAHTFSSAFLKVHIRTNQTVTY